MEQVEFDRMGGMNTTRAREIAVIHGVDHQPERPRQQRGTSGIEVVFRQAEIENFERQRPGRRLRADAIAEVLFERMAGTIEQFQKRSDVLLPVERIRDGD